MTPFDLRGGSGGTFKRWPRGGGKQCGEPETLSRKKTESLLHDDFDFVWKETRISMATGLER